MAICTGRLTANLFFLYCIRRDIADLLRSCYQVNQMKTSESMTQRKTCFPSPIYMGQQGMDHLQFQHLSSGSKSNYSVEQLIVHITFSGPRWCILILCQVGPVFWLDLLGMIPQPVTHPTRQLPAQQSWSWIWHLLDQNCEADRRKRRM